MRSSLVRLAVVVGASFSVSGAFAASLTWNGTTGNASTSSKWSPQQIPTSSDDLFFPGSTTFTITFDGAVPGSLSQTFRNTVTANLSVTSPHSLGGAFSIGTFSGDSPTVHLTTGDITAVGGVTVADVSGSSGTLTIDGDDASLVNTGAASDVSIGRGGTGNLTISGGGLVQAGDDVILGALSTGNGTATVTGGTGSLPFITLSSIRTTSATSGDIIVGNIGDGTLNLQNGGLALAERDFKIAPSSSATGIVDLSGSFSILGSRITVNNNLDIARNDSITPCGTATIMFNAGTGANVTGMTRIGDPDGGTGTLVLNSGFITSDGGIDVQTNGNITGTGNIIADITNLGDITPTGANGLTINGILNNTTSNRIVGTEIFFDANGGYNGSGTCQADISGDPTSTITATGTLSIGRSTAAGFFYLGTLAIGAHDVTLVDSNGPVIGGLVTMAPGGQVSGTSPFGVQSGGRIRGEGTISTLGQVNMAGVLDPQRSPTPGGIMDIDGNLHMNSSGEYAMEIGGTPASDMHDRCDVTGTATFDGTLRVTIPNGYVPRVGQQYIAINATAGRTGEFATLIPPSPAPCNNVTFVLVYSSTAAIVLVRPPLGCTALGDLNSDGGCSGKDIQLFVNALTSPAYESCADMDGDCANDLDDVEIFLNCLL